MYPVHYLLRGADKRLGCEHRRLKMQSYSMMRPAHGRTVRAVRTRFARTNNRVGSRLTDAGQQSPHYPPVRIGTRRDSLHRLLSEGLSLLFGLSLVLCKRHPFADDFSASLVFRLHVQILRFESWSTVQMFEIDCSLSAPRRLRAAVVPDKHRASRGPIAAPAAWADRGAAASGSSIGHHTGTDRRLNSLIYQTIGPNLLISWNIWWAHQGSNLGPAD